MVKACPNCGSDIIGRVDKRFCDDQCRSAYYNKTNRDSSNIVRKINSVLRKNRRVLEGLNPDGKTVVSKEELLAEGFSFNYFTSSYTTKTGKKYHFVYEYGYVALEKEKYGLVLKGDWVS